MILAVLLFGAVVAEAQDTQLKVRTPEGQAARAELERRITLDIEVVDASGRPVRGLPRAAFHVEDAGKTTALVAFKEVDGSIKVSPAPVEAILLMDAMNSTVQNLVLERQGVDRFLRQNGGRLPLPVSLIVLTDTGAKFSKSSTNGLALASYLSTIPSPARMLASQGISGAVDREQRSLRALELLSRYEASQPGRKLLVWMGPGWPLLTGLKSSDLSDGNARRYYTAIVNLTTSMRRAHVTIYSVEPLNLQQGTGHYSFVYQDFLKVSACRRTRIRQTLRCRFWLRTPAGWF